MKIWIFNILVAGALVYLFLGESEQTRVKSDLEWAKKRVETSIDAAEKKDALKITAPQSAPPQIAKQDSTPAPKPEATEKPVSAVNATVNANVEPPAAPQPSLVVEPAVSQDVTMRDETVTTGGAQPRDTTADDIPPLDDPEVARRRAEVLDMDTPNNASSAAETSLDETVVTAVTARDRREALNALAEDMELIYVERASR